MVFQFSALLDDDDRKKNLVQCTKKLATETVVKMSMQVTDMNNLSKTERKKCRQRSISF